MPYVLTSESRFATEENWINASCEYDFSSLCFMLQYYACQCNKKSIRFLNETKYGNPPLPLEISAISCTVKLGLISSVWELPTVIMEPQRHLKYGPFFWTQSEKPVNSKTLYNWWSVIQSVRQSVCLDTEPVVGFNTCLIGVKVWPLSAVTVSVGCVCTHPNNLRLRYLQCLVVFPIRSTCAVYRAPVIADNALS